jgi:hypothetical protein
MSRVPSIVALGAACALAGCSGPATQAPPKVTVEGEVRAQGRPVAFVLVRFYPQDPADANAYDGSTDQAGAFSVQCPAGSYKVTIIPLPVGHGGTPGAGALAGADSKVAEAIPAVCRSREATPLTVEVPAGGKKGVTLTLP